MYIDLSSTCCKANTFSFIGCPVVFLAKPYPSKNSSSVTFTLVEQELEAYEEIISAISFKLFII